MRDIDVAAQHEVARLLQRRQVGVKLGQKAELGGLAFLTGRAAGEIAADDGQLGAMLAAGPVKAQLHIAALGVELRRAIAHDHIAGFMLCVHRHAGIAFFLGKMEVALEPGNFLKFAADVGGLRLELLHANTIRHGLCNPVFKAFAGGGTDAVEVEAG